MVYQEKSIDLMKVTDKHDHIKLYGVHLSMGGNQTHDRIKYTFLWVGIKHMIV